MRIYILNNRALSELNASQTQFYKITLVGTRNVSDKAFIIIECLCFKIYFMKRVRRFIIQ